VAVETGALQGDEQTAGGSLRVSVDTDADLHVGADKAGVEGAGGFMTDAWGVLAIGEWPARSRQRLRAGEIGEGYA
jgi:hypothetical protein